MFAGTSSGDLIGFLVKNKMLVFSINVCAMGVQTIKAVSADRIVVGGGDGQVALFKTNARDTAQTHKIQLFGAIHGLSVSPDGLQSLVATEKGYIYRVRNNDFSQMLLCENHTAPVLSCWFNQNSSDKFITTSEDGTIRLWDSNNYTVIARCIASSGSIAQGTSVYANCATFTEEIILSGWSDGRIRAYRADNCT